VEVGIEPGIRVSNTVSPRLDNRRVPFEKAVQITHLLVEGVGVRAAARLAGVNRNTILAVLEVVGQAVWKSLRSPSHAGLNPTTNAAADIIISC